MAKPKKVTGHLIRYIGLLIIVSFCTYTLMISLTGEITTGISYSLIGIENSFHDSRYRDQMTSEQGQKQDKNIVLAEIDDESLQTIGRWPWSRTKWAQFIRIMKDAGAKVLSFDIIMSEPETACNEVSPDIALGEAIKDFQSVPGNHIIMPYVMTDLSGSYFKEMPDILYNYILDSRNKVGANFIKKKIENNTFPVKDILDADPGLGPIGVDPDPDGVFRQYPVVNNVDDTYYLPSMGLLAYELFTKNKTKLEVYENRDGKLKTKLGEVLLNFMGTAKIRYLGTSEYYPRISLEKILSPKPNLSEIKKIVENKIVYVGSTAVGAHDLRNTPIDNQMPGVYSHMNFTSTLLQNHFFQNENDSLRYSLMLLALGVIILISFQQLLGNAYVDILCLAGLLSGTYYLDKFYFLPNGYELKLFFTFFCYIGIYSWNTLLNFSAANKEKKQIKGTFSRYVAPAIVNQMLSEPDKLVLGGEKKNITCIFSDVRDFTSISEKLTATELSQCLNIYMSKMTDILFETYGTLDKYIGDAIVGYWGAPLELENHAYHGVRGALQMIEALPAINDQFEAQGFPIFKIGIGLNSGECSLGNMGSDKIFSYTALGDNMNLGARLEGLCKYYGVQINISEFTLNAIPEDKRHEFKYRSLDIVRVKGKEKPVKIFEVLHSTHDFMKNEKALQAYESAYLYYLDQKFSEALQILDELSKLFPEDKPVKLLQNHCTDFLSHPPGPNWDGVTTHKEK
ncbi:MAG: CHASE2 domain-containing protein [Bacteriovoracaceae bacterium]